MSASDFLVEIGTEELPPKALRTLKDAFATNLTAAVDEARLAHATVHSYASPRRLCVLIEKLASGQKDNKVTQKGPPVKVAFDENGAPKPAAIAFAKKCGVEVDALARTQTDKGEWLSFEQLEKGKPAAELIPELVEKALSALPIPRRMRWGAGDAEFVRPVHWIVLLHGDSVLDASVMGIKAGRETQGHRFHSDGAISIATPGDYLQTLEKEGHVVADFDQRRAMITDGVTKEAQAAGGEVVDGESLYDEVAALVEWPVPLTGSFDEAFLQLPREVIVSTLTGHQRYFPLADASGALLPKFVTVANIASKDPDQVRDGNERVIAPRLADAAFFWDHDQKRALADRQESLHDVVYQRGLGSLYEKSARTAKLAALIATALDADTEAVERAALLCKCDLLTGMVGEFPELQGTMGRYYAQSSGEPQAVADAIGEHYQPRFAGDSLPASKDGQVLALADKLDTLAGVFAIGKKPSGNRDPFGLRRAALGVIRILVECGLDIDLPALITAAVEAQPIFSQGKSKLSPAEVSAELVDYVGDRLRRYFLDRDSTLATETFDAVLARRPASLVDFDRRLAAVQSFTGLDEAADLAAANKRIANILRKAGDPAKTPVSAALLQEPAEEALFAGLELAASAVRPLLEGGHYTATLSELAKLRDPVDRFFDEVMVMAGDEALKNNRLALLGELRGLFLDVADISRLSIA